MFIFDQLNKSDPPLRRVGMGVLMGMAILLVGLWFVQVVSSRRFDKALKNQSYRTVRIPAIRGKIMDRNGFVLADNKPTFNISLYLEELREMFNEEFQRQKPRHQLTRSERLALRLKVRFAVANNLVQQLSWLTRQPIALNEAQFHRHYQQWPYVALPVLTNLGPTNVARFQENSASTRGLDLEIQPTRYYPQQKIAAHLLGYLTRTDEMETDEEVISFNYRQADYKGVVGLEAVFDSDLRGKAGAKSVKINSLGYRQSEQIISQPEPGKNLVLTIDLPIQRAAERAIRLRNPDERAAAVVLDVRNGDILGLASNPSLDPNQFIPRVSAEDWQSLTNAHLRPLINRATFGLYQPGSIFKIVVGLAALEAGVLNPTNVLDSPGYYQLGNRKIKDTADGGQPGPYDFRRALKLSCNTYFIHYGLEVGLPKILEMGRRFHLGETTDIPTLQNARGYFPTTTLMQKQRARGDLWTDGKTANLSIGQGEITVTPLQMALMVAAVANGGRVFWPRLVQRIEPQESSGDDDAARQFLPRLRNELGVQPSNLAIICDAMRADVEDADGSGRLAAVPGMNVCGKTGTAEVKKGPVLVDRITWFASFAPYESPRYAVVIMVESGLSGGKTCAPMAQQIYRAIQERENPKTKTKPEHLAAASN